MNCQNTERY